MPTVKLITENESQGEIKEAYNQIKQMSGSVPETFQAMANHPSYMNLVMQKMQVVMGSEEIINLIDLVGSMNHFNNGMLIKPH